VLISNSQGTGHRQPHRGATTPRGHRHPTHHWRPGTGAFLKTEQRKAHRPPSTTTGGNSESTSSDSYRETVERSTRSAPARSQTRSTTSGGSS